MKTEGQGKSMTIVIAISGWSNNKHIYFRRIRRVLSTSDEDNEAPPTGSSSPQPNGSRREKKSKKPSKPKKVSW